MKIAACLPYQINILSAITYSLRCLIIKTKENNCLLSSFGISFLLPLWPRFLGTVHLSIAFIINIKMQELTKLDVDRLRDYSAYDSPLHPQPNEYNYPQGAYKLHESYNYKSNHQEITSPSTINEIIKTHHFTLRQHPENPINMVQSISVPQPYHHARKGSGILSIKELKDLQDLKQDKTFSRNSAKSQGNSSRKIFVSIAKSNNLQGQESLRLIELGRGSAKSKADDKRRKITLSKYINFRSHQKANQN